MRLNLWTALTLITVLAVVTVLFVAHPLGMSIIGQPSPALSFPRMVTIAPDGDQLYYDCPMTVPCIISASLKGWDDPHRVVIKNGSNPFLSRNGNRLFFERKTIKGIEIWYFDVKTKKHRKIASQRGQCRIHDVNADGSKVLLTTYSSSGGLGLLATPLLVDVALHSVTEIPECSEATFSPSGLVCSRVGKQGLWLRDEGNKMELLRPKGDFPVVSMNGQRVLYSTNVLEPFVERRWEIWDLNDERVIPLGRALNPVLTPDGNAVFSEMGSSTTWVVDGRTGKKKSLGELPGPVDDWRASPGGLATFAGDFVVLFNTEGTVRELPLPSATPGN